MKLTIKKGSTSRLIQIFLLDTSKEDGSGLTGLVYNSAGLGAYYIREGSASATQISLVTATVGTWSSGGFKEVDTTNMPGVYEIGVPDACLADGAEQVIIFLKGATKMVQMPLEIQLETNTNADIKGVADSILIDTGTTLPARFDGVEGATFATGTDSLEAIRNQGDSAWITGGGGAAPTVGEIRAEMEGAGYTLAAILADTGELQTDWVNGGRLDNILDGRSSHNAAAIWSVGTRALTDKSGFALSAAGANLILKDSAFALAMADAIWDEILTGATHNIATSAGRRVREIGAFAINSGTAQAGNSHSITLAATADANDGVYNRNLIVLTDNTGVGQTRTIVDYDATTKVVVVDRDWRVSPDATTEYQIVPDDTPLTVDHGVARGGTDTTITLRDYAASDDDAYLCNIIAIIAGTGRGQARLVGSYNGTTKVATICGEDWVANPDTTSVYVMMPYGTTCTSCVGDHALAQIKAALDAATVTDLKQHDNKITGLMSMDDDLDLSPETWLMFNSNNDLIQIRKFGANRSQFDLEVKDAAVTDRTVDGAKTIKYSGWIKSWEPGV